MKLEHIPNTITFFRFVLVPPVVFYILTDQLAMALLLFVVAGISDGVDGYLAKRFDWTSELGGWLDPLADKLLLVASFLALSYAGLMPWWLTLMVIGRDLVIIGGALAYRFLIGHAEASPLLVSKVNTVVQIITVVAVLLPEMVSPFTTEMQMRLFLVAGFMAVVSGAAYVITWSRRALYISRRNRSQQA